MKSLNDKVVVITGAGSGIGRALAVSLARRGARLALSDVNAAGLKETVGLAKAAGSPQVHSTTLDVADRSAFEAYGTKVVDTFGGVNVVINNAGVTMTGDFEDMTLDEFDWILGINLGGVITGTKVFLDAIIESGDGHIVNISSLFGMLSMPGQSAYNASKYAVRGFTEALREEMLINKHRVGVTCVHPGGIKTGIARNGRKTVGQNAAAIDKLFDEKLARMTPDKAAEIIVKGILKNQARVLVGLDAHVVHNFQKFTGSRYQDIVAAGARFVIPKKTV
ncbi:MAG: SDR family NAD(P)-dependent oxidoreductase [Nocardioides sp.]|uniref:SDR family NAD(P)-dependent oxidoreductase n=1 Tax=Nocardioides sp. TaxID=35761 RepID=UPI0039E542EC